ncbi:hypothetical protein EG68_12417 [Paragonimus skrjabini miyazakii]|uniref:MD-2-related lipid-recognition domain-containing protein n=1 Tax=Paragonimus skrjabini miyazakii TaxID=59628 RepID=A0A8S9YCT3_9TREM|nr:hypothetical protein EG68_12417 [Paragonimus skrjabini miyazakii]
MSLGAIGNHVFIFLVGLTFVSSAKFYTSCSKGSRVYNVTLDACKGAVCSLQQNKPFTLTIEFKSLRKLVNGRPTFCATDIPDNAPCVDMSGKRGNICNFMEPECPLANGESYTYQLTAKMISISYDGIMRFVVGDFKGGQFLCVDINVAVA